MITIQSIDADALSKVSKLYEKAYTDQAILPGSVLMARLDGRAFHSLRRNLDRPFDKDFVEVMISCSKFLLKEFHADFAYTQSDEISLAWVLKGKQTEFPFKGKTHKLNSLLASHCSVGFNNLANKFFGFDKLPIFDCRTWAVPTKELAVDTILWRQLDAKKNSVSMLAHHHFNDGELLHKTTGDRLQMLENKGISWENLDPKLKAGTFVFRVSKEIEITEEERAKLPEATRNDPIIRTTFEVDNSRLTQITDKVGFLFRNNNEI